jgi:hypothetical protein
MLDTALRDDARHVPGDFQRFGDGAPFRYQPLHIGTRGHVAAFFQFLEVQADDDLANS